MTKHPSVNSHYCGAIPAFVTTGRGRRRDKISLPASASGTAGSSVARTGRRGEFSSPSAESLTRLGRVEEQQDTLGKLFDAGAAMQVGFDLESGPAAEPRAIDLQVFHDPLHVVPRLGEGDLFDPVDRVDLGIARIAVTLDPFFDTAATGIVAGKRQDVGAAVVLEQPAELGSAKHGVVDRIGFHPVEVEAHA